MSILRNFLYLDTDALDQYVGQLEDGLRGSQERIQTQKGRGAASIGHAGSSLGYSSERANENRTAASDSPSARYERLSQIVDESGEELDWIVVTQPALDLAAAKVGTVVELDCELRVPPMIEMLAGNTLQEFATLARAVSSASTLLGDAATKLPAGEQIDALASLSSSFNGERTVIGEPDDDDWVVLGTLRPEWSRTENFTGPARMVGKVSAMVSAGSWKSLLTLPGMSLMSRAQRRELERKGPESPDDENWVKGPALVLDLLAIWR